MNIIITLIISVMITVSLIGKWNKFYRDMFIGGWDMTKRAWRNEIKPTLNQAYKLFLNRYKK